MQKKQAHALIHTGLNIYIRAYIVCHLTLLEVSNELSGRCHRDVEEVLVKLQSLTECRLPGQGRIADLPFRHTRGVPRTRWLTDTSISVRIELLFSWECVQRLWSALGRERCSRQPSFVGTFAPPQILVFGARDRICGFPCPYIQSLSPSVFPSCRLCKR